MKSQIESLASAEGTSIGGVLAVSRSTGCLLTTIQEIAEIEVEDASEPVFATTSMVLFLAGDLSEILATTPVTSIGNNTETVFSQFAVALRDSPLQGFTFGSVGSVTEIPSFDPDMLDFGNGVILNSATASSNELFVARFDIPE